MISLTELARRLCGAAFAGVLGLVAISTSVPAETRFGPGYPDRALLGPQAAQGAVIWNHGTTSYYGALDSSQSAIPAFVAALSDDRWDVFRLDRPPAGESPNTSTEALLAAISQLKAQGYRRIVLMGQSAGAWISLIAAGKSADVHAVIATAPAYYGVNRPKNTMNASALYGYLEGIKAARVMLAFFTDDPYDPGGRGAEADAILGRNGVPRLIVDRPEGLSGHGAGTSGLFYRRYGPCLRAIMGDGAVPKLSECQTDWGSKPSGEVQLPKDLAIARTGTGPAAPLLGTWWGVYLNGRELVLAVERADGDAVKAVYATGPLPGAVNKLDYVRVDGKVDGAGLSFERPGKAALHFRLRPDGDLDAEWIASDGTGRLTAILRRLQD
jgi:pimeloyl-ACP methyl ester carboxylesterase